LTSRRSSPPPTAATDVQPTRWSPAATTKVRSTGTGRHRRRPRTPSTWTCARRGLMRPATRSRMACASTRTASRSPCVSSHDRSRRLASQRGR
jgi:hypothetical protein